MKENNFYELNSRNNKIPSKPFTIKEYFNQPENINKMKSKKQELSSKTFYQNQYHSQKYIKNIENTENENYQTKGEK